MIRIAHRGNVVGPQQDRAFENEPHVLVGAIARGYDVEVDVWLIDGQVFLGHDEPTHLVDNKFLQDIGDNAWFHCKNLEALDMFVKELPDLRYFWHELDRHTLTSNGFIWTYPGNKITTKSILVYLGKPDLKSFEVLPYAICSDYVGEF
jgi:hypothetical protein